MPRLVEFVYVLRGSRVYRLPTATPMWWAYVSCRDHYAPTRRDALSWLVRSAWADAEENVRTRRFIEGAR